MATAILSSTTRSPAAALVLVILAMVCALMQYSVNGQLQCGPTVGASCTGSNCCSKNGYCGTQSDYCGSGCQTGYGKCSGSCFPASATVMTRGGITKPISELAIGEEVAVQTGKGGLEYDAVYAHGHLDSDALSEFIVLTLRSLQNENVTKTLQLSPLHFTIVLQGLQNRHEYKAAADVRVGDRMFATHDLQFSTFLVSGVEKQVMKGLYNPFTLQGNIVVNGVLASCHSEWFLYSTLKRICGAHVLPSVYQATLTPVRFLYNGMDKDAYKSLYNKIDSRFDIAKSGSGIYGYFKLLLRAFSPNTYEIHSA